MIESGFNPRAYSRAKAVGLWQFMLGTGRLYGLDRTHWVDERPRPGEGNARRRPPLEGLVRAIRRLAAGRGGLQFRKGARFAGDRQGRQPRFLGVEAAERDAQLRAAADGGDAHLQEPAAFRPGASLPPRPLPTSRRCASRKQMHLPTAARLMGIDYQRLRDLNPELRRQWTPPGKPYSLRVPGRERFLLAEGLRQAPRIEKTRGRPVRSPPRGQHFVDSSRLWGRHSGDRRSQRIAKSQPHPPRTKPVHPRALDDRTAARHGEPGRLPRGQGHSHGSSGRIVERSGASLQGRCGRLENAGTGCEAT